MCSSDLSPALRYVIIPFAGIPPKDEQALRQRPHITVMNSHFNSGFAAEHALGLMIAASRRFVCLHNTLRKGDWTPRYNQDTGDTLFGATVLIAGTGYLGSALARLLEPFGCRIVGVNTSGRPVEGFHTVTDRVGMLAQLPQCRFVVAALPLTDVTVDFFDEEQFAAFSQGTIFVNVGRGPTVNELAFVHALRSGAIRAAGIDTWWNYPPSVESRHNTPPCSFDLSAYPQIVATPHKATHVEGRETARMLDLARIVNSIRSGSPVNIVECGKGY